MTATARGRQVLLRQLTDARLTHLDARVLALHLLGDPAYLSLTKPVLAAVRDGEIRAQTSAVSLYQILAELYRLGRADLAKELAQAIQVHGGLELVPTTPEIAVQAAEVRAQLGGRPERAIQIATALVGEADVYLTTASGIRRIVGMTVINLEDHLAAG